MADALSDSPASLAKLSPESVQKLDELFKSKKLTGLINIRNPLDITPMADDSVHISAMKTLLEDQGIDFCVFGNVPFTAMVKTLPEGILPGESLRAPDGYAKQLIQLFHSSKKPFAIVLDSGKTYDPLYHYISTEGVPCFRSAERAVKSLAKYANYKSKLEK